MSQKNKLIDAVNAYLLAQNTWGFRDGDERCVEKRRELCRQVYKMNAKRNEKNG